MGSLNVIEDLQWRLCSQSKKFWKKSGKFCKIWRKKNGGGGVKNSKKKNGRKSKKTLKKKTWGGGNSKKHLDKKRRETESLKKKRRKDFEHGKTKMRKVSWKKMWWGKKKSDQI